MNEPNPALATAMAALTAAKHPRAHCTAAAEGYAEGLAAEQAHLTKLEAQLTELGVVRGGGILSMSTDEILALDDQMRRLRIDIEIAVERINGFRTVHAEALADLATARDGVLQAALRVASAELDVKARKFMAAQDYADELGRDLDQSIGPRTNLPAYIELALSRLPKRDDLHTPVNVLRAGGYKSQRMWDERIQQLILDDTDETQAETRVG